MTSTATATATTARPFTYRSTRFPFTTARYRPYYYVADRIRHPYTTKYIGIAAAIEPIRDLLIEFGYPAREIGYCPYSEPNHPGKVSVRAAHIHSSPFCRTCVLDRGRRSAYSPTLFRLRRRAASRRCHRIDLTHRPIQPRTPQAVRCYLYRASPPRLRCKSVLAL